MIKAKRPCKFGGRQFYVGDEIPEELVDSSRMRTLVKYGTIESVHDTPPEPPKAETGTNTSTGRKNGSEGDKRALNNADATAAKKQPAKKGGK